MLASASSEDDAQNVGITLMQGIATGSLLYVVFFEVIEKERAGRTSHAVQLIFIILGSATIVALKVKKILIIFHHSNFHSLISKVLEDVLSQDGDVDSVKDGLSMSDEVFTSSPLSSIASAASTQTTPGSIIFSES